MSTLRTQKKEFGLEDVQRWLYRNDDHHRITAIDLPGKRVSDDTAMLLNSLAMRCRRLRVLKLDRNFISDAGAKSLAEALPHFRNVLVHLDLSHNRLGARGAEEVAKAYLSGLQNHGDGGSCGSAAEPAPADGEGLRGRGSGAEAGRGRLLDLSHNELGDHGVAAVARHLSGRGEVRLRLRGVGCGQVGVNALLAFKEALAELDLGLNPMGVVGVSALCRAVCSAAHWRTLGLSYLTAIDQLNLQNRGGSLVTQLVTCVRGASQLRDLDCSGNGIGDYGGRMLVEALQESEPHTLERLAMGESGCGIQTSNALQTALRKKVAKDGGCAGLRVLELPSNRLTDECAAVLAEGVAKSLTLTRLLLSRNMISDRGTMDLANALELQRSNRDLPLGYDRPGCIVDLDLAMNPVGDEGASALAMAATASTAEAEAKRFGVAWGLERLYLADTLVGNRGLDALGIAVASRAALADSAADFLAKSCDDELLRTLRTRRVRMPAGFEVLGLAGLDDGPAGHMRNEAQSRLQELWPTPAVPADEAAGTSRPSTPRRSDEAQGRWGTRSPSPAESRSPEPLPRVPLLVPLEAVQAQAGFAGLAPRHASSLDSLDESLFELPPAPPAIRHSHTAPEGSWVQEGSAVVGSWLNKLSAAVQRVGAGGSGGGGGGARSWAGLGSLAVFEADAAADAAGAASGPGAPRPGRVSSGGAGFEADTPLPALKRDGRSAPCWSSGAGSDASGGPSGSGPAPGASPVGPWRDAGGPFAKGGDFADPRAKGRAESARRSPCGSEAPPEASNCPRYHARRPGEAGGARFAAHAAEPGGGRSGAAHGEGSSRIAPRAGHVEYTAGGHLDAGGPSRKTEADNRSAASWIGPRAGHVEDAAGGHIDACGPTRRPEADDRAGVSRIGPRTGHVEYASGGHLDASGLARRPEADDRGSASWIGPRAGHVEYTGGGHLDAGGPMRRAEADDRGGSSWIGPRVGHVEYTAGGHLDAAGPARRAEADELRGPGLSHPQSRAASSSSAPRGSRGEARSSSSGSGQPRGGELPHERHGPAAPHAGAADLGAGPGPPGKAEAAVARTPTQRPPRAGLEAGSPSPGTGSGRGVRSSGGSSTQCSLPTRISVGTSPMMVTSSGESNSSPAVIAASDQGCRRVDLFGSKAQRPRGESPPSGGWGADDRDGDALERSLPFARTLSDGAIAWAPNQSLGQDLSELSAQVERLQSELRAEKLARQRESEARQREREVAAERLARQRDEAAAAGTGAQPAGPAPPQAAAGEENAKAAEPAATGGPTAAPPAKGKGKSAPPPPPPPGKGAKGAAPGKGPAPGSATAPGSTASPSQPPQPSGEGKGGKGPPPPPPSGGKGPPPPLPGGGKGPPPPPPVGGKGTALRLP